MACYHLCVLVVLFVWGAAADNKLPPIDDKFQSTRPMQGAYQEETVTTYTYW